MQRGPVFTPDPAPRPRAADFRPGLDFVLGETLRRDPLGVTYRARDVSGGRDIAVTLYHAAATPSLVAIERFQDVMLLAAVDHPAILPTERVGRWRTQVAVARRLIYAPTVAEALPRGMRCDVARALEILRPIASALDAAHGAGVVHGDVRLEAISLTKSAGAMLVGCGVADGLDLAGVLVATLERRTEWASGWLDAAGSYLAPERWHGNPPDARSDQYALAAVAFRMLTGESPYAAEHVARVAELHRIAVIPRPSGIREDLPSSVDTAITRGLAKVAGERFTTVTAFVDALAGHPSNVRVVTDPAQLRPVAPPPEAQSELKPVAFVVALAVTVAVTVLVLLFASSR